jgi:hypothetical protein
MLHVAIIAGGPGWYRFFGAGERYALAAARGEAWPAVVTACIALVLAAWSAYALAGAGVLGPLPWQKAALCAIALVYCVRGLAVLPLWLQGRDTAFWWVSSGICLVFGAVHVLGLVRAWGRV